MKVFSGNGMPTSEVVADVVHHALSIGHMGPYKVFVSARGWESCLHCLGNRPFRIEPVESQGVIVTHFCGQETRILYRESIKDNDCVEWDQS